MDQNKNYAHELTILSKDLRYKDYEVNSIKGMGMGMGTHGGVYQAPG